MVLRRCGLLLSLAFVFSARPVHAQWLSNGNGICVFAGDQSYPATASDGAGGAFVVWVDRRLGGEDLYLQRITSTGAIAAGWATNGIGLCTAANNQRAPVIVPDGAGGVYVAWEDERTEANATDIYLQRVTATGVIAAGWPSQGRPVCTTTGAQTAPSLALESGAAVVAWEDARDGATDVYVQKVTAAGAVAWTANGFAACTGAGAQSAPSIVGDAAGGAIVAWQDERGASADIYAQRIGSAGAAAWAIGGVSVCGAANDQLAPHAIPDGAGGAVLTWDDYRWNNSDIFAQRVNAAGAPQWTAGGKALCTDLGEQYGGLPITDGAGGAIVPWTDFRIGVNLYAQRVTAAGATSWAGNGLAVSTVGDISDPIAAPDGAGGAYFVWADVRAGGLGVDLYAMRLTPAGVPASGWTVGGSMVCSATNDQLRPVSTLDASGSAIVSWFDARNANYDIYSARLLSGGAVDVPMPAAEGRSLVVAPNPMREGPVSLRFVLPVSQRARVELLDVTGRTVRVLLDRADLPAGAHQASWDGRDESGAAVPAGVYLVRLVRHDRVETHKLARVR